MALMEDGGWLAWPLRVGGGGCRKTVVEDEEGTLDVEDADVGVGDAETNTCCTVSSDARAGENCWMAPVPEEAAEGNGNS